jgi:hypothetical protein
MGMEVAYIASRDLSQVDNLRFGRVPGFTWSEISPDSLGYPHGIECS